MNLSSHLSIIAIKYFRKWLHSNELCKNKIAIIYDDLLIKRLRIVFVCRKSRLT